MNPPADLPGTLTVTSLVVLVVTVLVFTVFALGGHRTSSALRRLFDDSSSLLPVYALAAGLVAAMLLALGTGFAVHRYETALHELAWEAYDVWFELDRAGAAPAGSPPGEGRGVLAWVAVSAVVLAIVGLVAYVLLGFDRAPSGRRAVGWGAFLATTGVVLLGVAVLVMGHDVGLREQAFERWLGQEAR